MSVMPLQSTTIAPPADVERRLRPTRAMRLPCTSTSPAYGAAPVASKIRALVKSTLAMKAPVRLRCSVDRVLEDADAVDLDADPIAALQIFRRIESDADAAGCPGGDDVAGDERHAGGDRFDERGNVEDEIARGRVLAQLPVESAAHARVGPIEVVTCDDPRYQQTEHRETYAYQ